MPRQPDRSRRRAPDPTLRIGDAERNEAADALSQHYSAGRLDESELKERLDRAMRAKTGADLAGLTSDLPPLGPVTPPQPDRDCTPRHWTGLWIVIGALLALTLLAHGPTWWPWWSPVRFPWLLLAGIAFILWRRARRRRWRTGAP